MVHSLQLLLLALAAQDSPVQNAAPRLEEVIRRYEKGLLKIDGVKEIVPDQGDGKGVVLVRVESEDARDMVKLVTSEKLDGYPVRIVLSKTPLPLPPGTKAKEGLPPAGAPICGHCPAHCPGAPESKSDPASKEKPAAPAPVGPKKKPDPICTHCPLHCRDAEGDRTVAEPAPPATPAGTPEGTPKPASPEPVCDVARKLRGLPPLKSGRTGCEEIVSTSNNPDRIRWAIEKSLPHWVSKEMAGVKGTSRDGIPCGTHGSHSLTEFLCYCWVRHGTSCPMKDLLSPKDLAPEAKK